MPTLFPDATMHYMARKLSEIKEELKNKLSEIAGKRRMIVSAFKKKVVDVKIDEVKKDLLNKYK